MVALKTIDATMLRMSQFRYFRQGLSLNDHRQFATGGNIQMSNKLTFIVKDNILIARTELKAKLWPHGDRDKSEAAAFLELGADAIYSLPDGHGMPDGEVKGLPVEKIDTFLHVMEPILILKLRSMLSEAGASGVNIPLHVYVPNSARELSE